MFWEEEVEVVVHPDDGHVIVSFVASGRRNRWGKEPPDLQQIADAFAQGVSAELEGCRPPGAGGRSEARAHMRTVQRWSRIAQYFVWALVPTWFVATYLAGWPRYGIAAVPGAMGTFVLALLVSQSSLGMRPRRHVPIASLIIFGALAAVLLVCGFANLAH